jgi:arsenite methyltransferase
MTDVRHEVRERYADAARAVAAGSKEAAAFETSCCGPGVDSACCGEGQSFGSQLYEIGDREVLPDAALLGSLGCGNPTAVADLEPGETVLDLGSGGGIDVLLSARRVGPEGMAYGLDMTDEMLELANRNKAAAGVHNVEFLKGFIEQIPLPDGAVDVVISNCVINLSADKSAVFEEMHRVLRPGGRIGITDVVADDELTADDRKARGSYVGCIAGALSFEEYEAGLTGAGFTDIELTSTHAVADGMHGAIVKARKA